MIAKPKSSIRKIRKYQNECVAACLNNGPRGQVILPTGSGKTVIGEEIIKSIAARKPLTITAIYVPRLILGKQWIARTAKTLIKDAGLKFAFVNINSGGISNKVRESIEKAQYDVVGPGVPKIQTTTNAKEVLRESERLQEKGYHIILLSTYHSAQVLLESEIECDLAIYDECQYLVSSSGEENEFTEAMKIDAKHKLFFTATPRLTDSDEGRGMNNPELFGPVIFERKPREIIEAGAIVGPKIHLVGTNAILDEKDHNSRMEMIYQAWQKHKEVIEKASADEEKIGGKMLVVVDGQASLKGIFGCRRFKEIRRDKPELRMYGLSSDFGVYIDGKMYLPPVSGSIKEEFLAALDELHPNDDVIVFHVDMIAEGLDVPGLTGMLPLRNCGKIKFLQNLGRTTRPHPDDQTGIFETGKLKIGDFANYIKPHCYVILPYAFRDRDDVMYNNATLVDALRTEYGFDPSDIVACDNLLGISDDSEFDDGLPHNVQSAVKAAQDFYNLVEEEAMEVEEIVMTNKIRRFTPEQCAEFIGMAAG